MPKSAEASTTCAAYPSIASAGRRRIGTFASLIIARLVMTRSRHDMLISSVFADVNTNPTNLGDADMKLRLGQRVEATDGPFGELGDIIVDPIAKTVTHIVAEPHHKHQQARLIPMWLVAEADGLLTVGLDIDHLRQLEQVAYSDYMKFGDAIEVGDSWDIGTEDVFSSPYHDFEFDMGWYDNRIGVTYDRVPKGECEIRRTSLVIAADDTEVGTVHGFLADHDHLKAVIVRTGVPGFRHDILVPLGSVKAVRVDEIDLVLTEAQFGLLPRTEILGQSDDDLKAHVIDLRRRAEAAGGKLASTGRALAASAKDRLPGRN